MLHAEKSGRPGRLCDVMMTCGHCLGRGFEIPAHSPTHSKQLAPRVRACRRRERSPESHEENEASYLNYQRAWLFIPTPTVVESALLLAIVKRYARYKTRHRPFYQHGN